MLAAQHFHHLIAIESRVERIAGQMRDRHRNRAAVDIDDVGEHPAAEGALIDEAQGRAVVEKRGDAHVILARDRSEQHLPAHAQVDHQCLITGLLAVGEQQPQVLAAAVRSR